MIQIESLKCRYLMFLFTWLILYSFAMPLHVFSQSTILGNFTNGTTDFLGWDANTNTDMRIWHETPGQPIIFKTNLVERMRILPDNTVAINTTATNGARLNVLQDISGTGMACGLSNQNSNPFNRTLQSRTRAASNTNIAILAETGGFSQKIDIAVSGIAEAGNNQYGVYGITSGFGTLGNPNSGNWAGVFLGNVGIINGTYQSSDIALKQNIEALEDVRAKLLMLNPVSFSFIEHEDLKLPDGKQYGFIAQEVQDVFPTLVRETSLPISEPDQEGYHHLTILTLNQVEMIPLLVKGINEHEELISQSQERIQEMQASLEEIQAGLIINTKSE